MNTKIIAVAVAALAAVSLAGCSYNTMDDAKATPHSVIELTNASLFESSTFGYVDSEGEVQPLLDCGRDDLFSQRYCKSEGGLVSFSYSTYKSRIRNATVTVDGVKEELHCTLDGDDTWGGHYICIPK